MRFQARAQARLPSEAAGAALPPAAAAHKYVILIFAEFVPCAASFHLRLVLNNSAEALAAVQRLDGIHLLVRGGAAY